jgi:Xaa-Pro aminopeptidase
VPESEYVMAPGMVLALEVGSYGEGYGIRLEHVVVVTADGCKLLSGHTFAE